MKNRIWNSLTVLLCIALVLGAVCIGGVKGYSSEREELLLNCMQVHTSVNSGQGRDGSIQDCEDAAADFDARLKYKLMGRVAGMFGVEPISSQVQGLHAQLLRETDTTPANAPTLAEQVEELLDDHVDTSLSFGKIVWTGILLSVIFGKKGRKKGFTLAKLLAGFGLFRMWRKD